MTRSEAKFQNTANKMGGAFITLLESKEFADITIMDICKAAGVNRSTFYAHYENTYDLLKQAFDGMIAGFLGECDFGDTVDITDLRGVSPDELNFVTPQYLLPYLDYIRKHKRLYKIYNENAHAFEASKMDDFMIENVFAPIYAKHGVTDKKLIFYMQKYFLKGLEAIINEWVKNDCEDDIRFVCEIITYCIRPTARG